MQHALLTRTAALVFALTAAAALPARAEEASTAEQTIDVMNKLWGSHPGFRANHAKGAVVEGHFTPSKDAAALSKASLFKGPEVPVTARFSDGTGIPTVPDASPKGNPHGLAMRFKLADGDMDVVTNSLKVSPWPRAKNFATC